MDDLNKQIGDNIRKIRGKLKLSIEDTADRAGLHSTYLSQVERGVRNISVLALSKIALALNIKPASLLPKNPLKTVDNAITQRFSHIIENCTDRDQETIISVVKELAKQLNK